MPDLVLASASPARLRLLRAAGIDPQVVPSGVDEDDVTGPVVAVVQELAARKARSVAATVESGPLVLGCDSLFEIDGAAAGKPDTPEEARRRWAAMRGGVGVLHTGHCLIDTATGAEAAAVASTVVRFGEPTDAELDAYIATGEPLAVAGACTIDGYGAPFVEGVEGDPSNVIGLSLPLLRRLLAEVGVAVTDLWR